MGGCCINAADIKEKKISTQLKLNILKKFKDYTKKKRSKLISMKIRSSSTPTLINLNYSNIIKKKKT